MTPGLGLLRAEYFIAATRMRADVQECIRIVNLRANNDRNESFSRKRIKTEKELGISMIMNKSGAQVKVNMTQWQ